MSKNESKREYEKRRFNEHYANYIYEQALKQIEEIIGNQTTWSNDLANYGKQLFGDKFLGVFPSDMIPKLSAGHYCIANLDKASEDGSHWVSLASDGKNLYVYDSFGRKTSKILNGAGLENVQDADYDAEQDVKETNCGQRSLAWLVVYDELGPELALLI